MKAKFTSGPWQVLIHSSYIEVGAGLDKNGFWDDKICNSINHKYEADAHLITASPDMYNKLKEIADNNFFTSEINELLAKARGEL